MVQCNYCLCDLVKYPLSYLWAAYATMIRYRVFLLDLFFLLEQHPCAGGAV